MTRDQRWTVFLLAGVLAVFAWSVIRPHDYFTWFLEVLPALIGFAVLAATYARFRFTTLVYTLIAVHMMILMVGGHYTYERVPPFNWVRDHFHLARNDYDRVGHFAQGFVPALITRELLLRTSPLRRGFWLAVLPFCACMAISAIYELFEWQVAVRVGSSAESFLGTQGDPWDTQEDMATCLVGAVTSLLLLSHWHNRQLASRGWLAGKA